MAVTPLTELVMAAATLKGVGGHAFQQVCAALRSLEKQAVTELVVADGNELYRVQGKLKILRQLRKHFVECTELRDAYQRRNEHGRPTP
jgi:hypothetical protein